MINVLALKCSIMNSSLKKKVYNKTGGARITLGHGALKFKAYFLPPNFLLSSYAC